MSPVALVTELRDLTVKQVAAATAIDGARLRALNSARSDLLFELQVALAQPLSAADKAALRPLATELDVLEARLRAAASHVVETLDRIVPSTPPTTYGRHGLVL